RVDEHLGVDLLDLVEGGGARLDPDQVVAEARPLHAVEHGFDPGRALGMAPTRVVVGPAGMGGEEDGHRRSRYRRGARHPARPSYPRDAPTASPGGGRTEDRPCVTTNTCSAAPTGCGSARGGPIPTPASWPRCSPTDRYAPRASSGASPSSPSVATSASSPTRSRRPSSRATWRWGSACRSDCTSSPTT